MVLELNTKEPIYLQIIAYMKKKIVLFIVTFVLLSFVNANSPKWYSDSINQYGGFAGATYASSDATLNLSNVHEIAKKVSEIENTARYQGPYKKLSKEDSFLIWSSLNEWNYNNGDIYNVVVAYNSGIMLFVTVRIKTKNSFDYVASCYRLVTRR